MKNIIKEMAKVKTEELLKEENAIVVLKGIPISFVDPSVNTIDFEKLLKNRVAYLMSIIKKNRRILSYEEFLLMSNFIVDQYKKVYILNNNIYMDQFPIEEYFSEDIRKGLLRHFEDSDEYEKDDSYIGDIEEYISIFTGLKEHNGYLIGAYNIIPSLDHINVITVNLFEHESESISSFDADGRDFIDLIEESDYIDFIKLLLSGYEEICIRITNYVSDKNKLKDRIHLVAFYFKKYLKIFFVQEANVQENFEHREDYTKILNKYWGYSSFKTLPIYDMSKLDQGQKEVVYISQENIISNIVQEVENCGKRKDFKDIFVTAPTGAGKSVMFQIPAIYLAEKYKLLTIVISPLIGLMNDQVKNLGSKYYNNAETINSDISPIIKQDIIKKVEEGKCDILYISPETLLSRSDVKQLIGNRTIGMIAIDEAHIVTTWGKQFRPDYWYLGEHIRKLRKQQIETKGRSFVITTFTATAIYRGVEDMYTETINSLHMLNPITYLGYVKRDNIDIVINKSKKEKKERSEYELDKFEEIEELLTRSIITNKKTLVYFPTVALINRCYEYLRSKNKVKNVSTYYGTLPKDKKQENYDKFCKKEKLLMLATKAFGMGIDINDIEIVAHFAPTGNVCDYVQEIGRAARKDTLIGEAFYHYNTKDFKHINRLHGLSTIKRYQLIEVLKKISELYTNAIRTGKKGNYTKKRNAMLLDAENFSYIFGSPISDEDSNVNKVKTALLLIQKDFENKIGFSPINVRPIPMFSIGFFKIDPKVRKKLEKKYPEAIYEIEPRLNICRIHLNEIWNKDYKMVSFPKFKYYLYSNNQDFNFNKLYPMNSTLCVNIVFEQDYNSKFRQIWDSIRGFIMKKVQSSEYTATGDIIDMLVTDCNVNKYKAQTICEVVLSSMDSYRKNFAKTSSTIIKEKATIDGKRKYQFNVAVNSYFRWIESGLRKIETESKGGKLYLVNDSISRIQEYNAILGLLESLDILSFETIGGANSQLYIYINQIQAIKNIINSPNRYHNRLLEMIGERHLISVKMLTYLYEGDFTNEERWNLIEDYFLGVIPERVKDECIKYKPEMKFL